MKLYIQLKSHPEYFNPLWNNLKSFEIRKDDRNYRVGIGLFLYEYEPSNQKYTGRIISADIVYLLRGKFILPNLPESDVILSLRKNGQWTDERVITDMEDNYGHTQHDY